MGMGMRMGTGSCVESGEERKNHSLCAPWLPFRNETTVLLAYNLDNAPVLNDSDMPDGLHTAHPCKEQPYTLPTVLPGPKIRILQNHNVPSHVTNWPYIVLKLLCTKLRTRNLSCVAVLVFSTPYLRKQNPLRPGS